MYKIMSGISIIVENSMVKKFSIIASLALASLTSGCVQNPTENQADQYVVSDETLAEAHAVAMQLSTELGGRLKKELSENGPAIAVDVCHIVAPEIASSLSQKNNWQVGRVGTRVRNTLNLPNTWQQAALTTFAEKAAKGEKFEQLETHSVAMVDGKPMLRYAKAIGLQPMCVVCHGKAEQIPASVKARLQEKYPNDRAVDYSPGELRGAIVILRPILN
jgi:hypothetical protein